jgi:hypothetical protein
MKLGKLTATAMDTAMCAMMYAVQRRHKLHANSRRELEDYIAACERLTRDAYFAAPASLHEPAAINHRPSTLHWPSPVTTGFPANDRTHVDLFPCAAGWSAPTVIMLHALMSASDIGYRRWAADFNERGWNACFVHLPFHYSRKPRGYFNGELAITADLVRNAQGLRQGVSEVRQLMAALREKGCREFGVWAASYGGWIGALLASVERDFRFLALMEPIVDVSHAIWVAGTGAALRRELRAQSIEPALIERHFHLTSPLHAAPLDDPARIIFCAGEYDHIARAADIAQLHEKWRGSELLHVAQGHFGYRMMPAVWTRLVERGVI